MCTNSMARRTNDERWFPPTPCRFQEQHGVNERHVYTSVARTQRQHDRLYSYEQWGRVAGSKGSGGMLRGIR